MNNNPYSTSRQGLAPSTNLTLIQHNSLGSWDVFLYLSSSLAEGPPDIVLLQDPSSSKGFLPSFSGFKPSAPPRWKAQSGLLRVPRLPGQVRSTTFLPTQDGRLYDVRRLHAPRLLRHKILPLYNRQPICQTPPSIPSLSLP